LLRASEEGRLRGTIAVVISDRPDAPALERARRRGVPVKVIEPPSSRARMATEVERRYVEALREARAGWLMLAGFFRIVGAPLLEAFPDRILNIHPSLLPSFPGLHAPRQALEHGVRIAGCTVHLVGAAVDAGPILAQAAVAVHPHDSEESLADRILVEEHRLIVATLNRVLTTPFTVAGRVVRWGDAM